MTTTLMIRDQRIAGPELDEPFREDTRSTATAWASALPELKEAVAKRQVTIRCPATLEVIFPSGRAEFPVYPPRPEPIKGTWDEFVHRMEHGWSFWAPGTVMSIGEMLREKEADQAQPVNVEFTKPHEGSGSNFKYVYRWAVTGANLPIMRVCGWVKESTSARLVVGYEH